MIFIHNQEFVKFVVLILYCVKSGKLEMYYEQYFLAKYVIKVDDGEGNDEEISLYLW